MGLFSGIVGAVKGFIGIATDAKAKVDYSAQMAEQQRQISLMQQQLTTAQQKTSFPIIPIVLGLVGVVIILFIFLRKKK